MTMFKMDVCIPTLNRKSWAQKLISMVENQCHVRVSWEKTPRAWTTIANELIRASYEDGYDIVILLNDHVRIQEGFFDAIDQYFYEFFPDTDGVVGFNLTNLDPLPNCREFSYVAIGRTFIERFPDCQCECPDYYHFYADTELGEYAKSVDRFLFGEDARISTVLHNRISCKTIFDKTFKDSRIHKSYDDWMRIHRQHRMLWGKTFDRISEGYSGDAAVEWEKKYKQI